MVRVPFAPVLPRAAIAFAATVLPAVLFAQGLRLDEVASGFDRPLFVTHAPSDSRLFVVEQGGLIRAVGASGAVSTYADLTGVLPPGTGGEMGLLGLAFDPGHATNGRFYVNYAHATGGTFTSFIARYDPAAGGGFDATPILSVPALQSNHKAGWIGFRPGEPDHLYIGTGDGGGSNDPQRTAQDPASNLGKILRVDVSRDDFAADPSRNYGIPSTNPYAGRAGNDEIWALGLRNPYRASFDRATGDLWIGDVGQGSREEIDFLVADAPGGANFGWSRREGDIAGPNPSVGDPASVLTDPVLAYVTTGTDRGSVTGGYVYRGPIDSLEGTYFFGDFVRGTIGSLRLVNGVATEVTDWTTTLARPAGIGRFELSSFGEDAAGNLYVTDYGSGRVLMLVPELDTWFLTLAGLLAMVVVAPRERLRR